jgi:hypothetical protein
MTSDLSNMERKDEKRCEGHVFLGSGKEDDKGFACLGKKGERMVFLD